ncbi:MAG: aminoglycoside phosphotransferase family protein [Desulfobulbaceae bacterium]|nr:aminoglycoside phosphotransferase family protein [Desulfobulbaceae bacterium]
MPFTDNLPAEAKNAIEAFYPGRPVLKLAELGEGNINDTFLVILGGERTGRYVLQRLNARVFPRPELIMANLRVLADHLDRRLREDAGNHFVNWQTVRPVPAVAGLDYHIDQAGNFWRLLNYIRGGTIFKRLPSAGHGREAGRALGIFHRLVSDLDPGRLADTLPGFHVTPRYLADYDGLIRRCDGADEEYCAGIIERSRSFAPVLENAARDGLLSVRVIHGDPRLANILFDGKSGKALAIIDLDTVKPGLLHYDLGDCLRSSCDPAGDDSEDPGKIRFDTGVCAELLRGYITEMGPLLTEADCEFIYPAVRLLTFELGLRFFTDHLAGGAYFKVRRPGHNLERAVGQFKLLESIEASAEEIRGIARELCRSGLVGS